MSKQLIGIIIVVIIAAGGIGVWSVQEYAENPRTITIAGGKGAVGALLFIALERGCFKDEGLDVTYQQQFSGKASLESVLEGKADFAMLGDTPLMHAALKREKIYVVVTITTAEENLAIIARRDRGIETPHDLRGKRIGAALGSNGEFFLDVFLTHHLISGEDVEVVHTKPEGMPDALTKGTLDAVSVWNPHNINSQRALGDNGVTFTGKGIYTESVVLAARQDFVQANPETLRKFLRAIVRAEAFVRNNPEEAITVVANYIRIDKGLLNRLWSIYAYRVSLDQALIVTLEDKARWAIMKKLTDETQVPDYLNFIHIDALEAVKPEAVTIIR